MLKLSRLVSGSAPKSPSTAPGDRVYAIGDIHGRYDLLRKLLDQIEDHTATLPPAKSIHVILLGDLIDRGPDSARVLKLAYDVQRKTRNLFVLLGNHEELMIRALSGEPGMVGAWMKLGGRATLRSFGIEPPEGDYDLRAFTRQVSSAIPGEILEWLKALPLSARSGDYFFCHAGVRPGVALKRQVANDLLWIRDGFLDSEVDHGAVIVHGHSVATDVQLRYNRIGIDTGAYRTNLLTGLYLEGEQCEILSARTDE